MSKRFGLVLAVVSAAAISGCVAPMENTADSDEDIIGGVTDNGDPAVVALFAHQPNAQSGSLCTASLISPTVLLHAAHCVDPREVGSGNVFVAIQGTSLNRATAVTPIKETHFDPAFNPNALGNGHDIGISILSQPLQGKITPLPFNRAPLSNAFVGKAVRLVGYGINQANSNAGAGTKRQVTTTLDALSPNKQLLEIGTRGAQTCNGDSGGPAFMNINGVETIVGVTSFGQVGCNSNAGGFDTRVDTQLAFIQQFVK